jgi:uncharacterized protein YndB with AHSA1/START domain
MSSDASTDCTQDIVVEEEFPHAPELIWKTLTSGALMARWIKMPMSSFEPVVGQRFTLQTTPAGAWDGLIRCEVLEVIPYERFAYTWNSGHEANVGYGSKLETVVTFTLTRVENGTRLRMVHSGFVLPKNAKTFGNLSDGWKKVVGTIGAMSGGSD